MSELSSAIPHVFLKCAQAEEKKGVAALFDAAVCDKCAQTIQKKEDELPGLWKASEACAKGHSPAFRMIIKRKEIWEEGFVGLSKQRDSESWHGLEIERAEFRKGSGSRGESSFDHRTFAR